MTLRNGLAMLTVVVLAIAFLVLGLSALADDEEDLNKASNAYRVKIFYAHKVDAASATKDLEDEINQWLSENEEVEVISVGQGCQGTMFIQNGKPLLIATLVTTIVYRFKQQ